jgi:hypothetical protein
LQSLRLDISIKRNGDQANAAELLQFAPATIKHAYISDTAENLRIAIPTILSWRGLTKLTLHPNNMIAEDFQSEIAIYFRHLPLV